MFDLRYAAAVSILAAVMIPAAAKADDTGFASSHTLRSEGGHKCMADHFHSGTGSGKSKESAKAAAAKAWAEFTALEYGSDWARISRARSISVKYTKEASGWTATVDARPCK